MMKEQEEEARRAAAESRPTGESSESDTAEAST
jgi:hypothetical protein